MAQRHKKKAGSWGLRSNSFHLLEPLTAPVGYQPEGLIAEALRRGADTLTLLRLLRANRKASSHSSVESFAQFGSSKTFRLDVEVTFASDLSSDFEINCIQYQIQRYEEELRIEFAGLPPNVRASFGKGSGRKRPKQPDQLAQFQEEEVQLHFMHYKNIRWRYYNAGYSRPADQFLSQIEETTILGHQVAGGLHQSFKERVGDLEKELEGWQKGLASQVGKAIKSIGGFCPRTIAGKDSLSNHAYGLAIDVDAPWNPHVKGPKTIAVLKEVTGYDFGAADPAVLTALTPPQIPKLDVLAQINGRMQQASELFRNWLRSALPLYLQRVSVTNSKMSDDAKIEDLLKEVSLDDLKHWADRGIQTIPLPFAAAMGKLGFRWGAEYRTSKDIMHFELLAEGELARDSPARSVNNLFPVGLQQFDREL